MKKVLCSAEKSSVIWAKPHSRSSAELFGWTEWLVGPYLPVCRNLQYTEVFTFNVPVIIYCVLQYVICSQKSDTKRHGLSEKQVKLNHSSHVFLSREKAAGRSSMTKRQHRAEFCFNLFQWKCLDWIYFLINNLRISAFSVDLASY